MLSHHAIDHMVINTSSELASLKHQVRWMKSTRFSRPKGHFGTALTFSMPFGSARLDCGAWPWVIRCLGLVASWLGVWPRVSRSRSRSAARSCTTKAGSGCLVLYPMRDLMGFCFWLASYGSNTILWRGQVFQLLPGGKMRAAKQRRS